MVSFFFLFIPGHIFIIIYCWLDDKPYYIYYYTVQQVFSTFSGLSTFSLIKTCILRNVSRQNPEYKFLENLNWTASLVFYLKYFFLFQKFCFTLSYISEIRTNLTQFSIYLTKKQPSSSYSWDKNFMQNIS